MPYTLPQDSGLNFSRGMDQLFIYVAREVPSFIPLFLFSFFSLITIGGYTLQKKLEGGGDFFMWTAVGGFLTVLLALLLSLIEGLINPDTLVTVVVLLIGIAAIYLVREVNRRA